MLMSSVPIMYQPAQPACSSAWHLQRAGHHLRATLQALLQAWRIRQHGATGRLLLQHMDDRELRDLGLGRGEIEQIFISRDDDVNRTDVRGRKQAPRRRWAHLIT